MKPALITSDKNQTSRAGLLRLTPVTSSQPASALDFDVTAL